MHRKGGKAPFARSVDCPDLKSGPGAPLECFTRTIRRVANKHAPSLDFRRQLSYKLYDLDVVVLFVQNFGVPSHVERVFGTRPWASPGQPENSRSDLVESHLAGAPASEPLITTFEKRRAMPDRKSLVSTLWLASSLALLASVLVEPIRTSAFVSVSSRPDCVRRNFALPPGQPTTRVGAAMATDDVLQVNALPSENEEQDGADPLDEPRVSFLIPSSFRKVPDRQLTGPRLDPLPLPAPLLIVR